MRVIASIISLLLFTTVHVVAQNNTMKNNMDSVSYSLGLLVANNLKSQGFSSLDLTQLTKGMQDIFSGATSQVSLEQANEIVSNYAQAQQAKQHEGAITTGETFLSENAKRPEVTTLPSGLQYEIMKKGEGAVPKATDRVEVHYTGTLLDGTVFDSSVSRGEPAVFGVTQVIQGWVEALQLMPAGSKWKLFIPYDLAYGERGAGGSIGPYSTLIFEVELLSIK